MKTAIVTGSGFIGKHLTNALLKDGVEVLEVSHQQLRDPDYLIKIKLYKPDLIFHTSAYGNIITQQDETETLQANYYDLYTLLQATKNILYEVFINFSSSSTLLSYETFYSATKGAGERLCKAFATKYNKNIISVQPYTVVGTGEHEGHLIPRLIRSCLKGEKMQFVGSPVHDFIGVNDFLEAIKLIIEKYYLGGNVEIGTGIKTSNEEILKLIEEITGKKANIIRVGQLRAYDTMDWKANNVIISSLGWVQKETLRDIIKGMIDYERLT